MDSGADVVRSPITRPCAVRYCQYVGPLYRDQLFLVEGAPQALVGGCWYENWENTDLPRHFVCNRCAHRALVHDRGDGSGWRVWRLHCPFCGEPLGAADAPALLFGADGQFVAELKDWAFVQHA